jgi:3-dehydroquinate synthase
VSHGDAVGLGMICALDVGRALSVTPRPVAERLEEGLRERAGVLPRSHLASALAGVRDAEVAALLAADKKSAAPGKLQMVLADAIGHAVVRPVPAPVWRPLLRAWRNGGRA